MDGALLVVLVVVLLVLSAVAFVPAFLSWPRRVRWAVAAQALSHAGFGVAVYALDLREVVLVSVHTSGGTLALAVAEIGRPPSETLTFVRTPTPAGDVVSMLCEWCALRTPMLLHTDAAGSASLHGPAAAVANLRRVRAPAGRTNGSTAPRLTP